MFRLYKILTSSCHDKLPSAASQSRRGADAKSPGGSCSERTVVVRARCFMVPARCVCKTFLGAVLRRLSNSIRLHEEYTRIHPHTRASAHTHMLTHKCAHSHSHTRALTHSECVVLIQEQVACSAMFNFYAPKQAQQPKRGLNALHGACWTGELLWSLKAM